MLVTYTYDPGTPLTPEQLKRIQSASKRPIVFDEDCPELTPEMLEEMHSGRANLRPQSQALHA